MNKKILIIIFIFLLFPAISFAENQFPSFPMAFWGEADLDGQPLPEGTEISVFCGNELANKVIMPEDGIYAYSDPVKKKLIVGECDEDIFFKLSDNTTIKHDSDFIEGTTNKNLTFIKKTTPTPSPPSRGGGGGSGDSPSDDEEDHDKEEGEVLGEADERISLDKLKTQRERLSNIKRTVDKLINVVGEEDARNNLETVLGRIENLEERVEDKIQEKEEKMKKLTNQKERIVEIRETVKMLFKVAGERDDAKDVLTSLLEKIEDTQNKIEDKIKSI